MDIIEIAQEIFSKPPKESNSIQLDFSDFKLNIEGLFQQLLMMFTEAMKIHYGNEGNKVDLSRLSLQDFAKINQYFNSFGFSVYHKVKPVNFIEPPDTKEKKVLKDYYVRLRSGARMYILSFDHFIGNTTCHNI